jgi:glycosyltransferase involved in cell wall biosynthesis
VTVAPTPAKARPQLSVITPAFNEAENLPLLYERLAAVLDRLQITWEWVVIDDHSHDATFAKISALATREPRIRGIRFARNFGSHAAITCGLHHADGDAVLELAADLQDPPEILPELLAAWRKGAHVVWAVRGRREGERVSTWGFARVYYFLMRHVAGLKQMAPTGADVCLLDRRVVLAFRQFGEAHVSIFALIAWMGFRQASIVYTKRARQHGRSGWTIAKRIELLLDSITAFSALPVRVTTAVGLGLLAIGLAGVTIGVGRALVDRPVPGWSWVLVVLAVLGGLQMMALGILGEYVWRALDESRRRPRYVIETTTDHADGREASGSGDTITGSS